jgi:hypothetical protein
MSEREELLGLFRPFVTILRDLNRDMYDHDFDDGGDVDWQSRRLAWAWARLKIFAARMGPEFFALVDLPWHVFPHEGDQN